MKEATGSVREGHLNLSHFGMEACGIGSLERVVSFPRNFAINIYHSRQLSSTDELTFSFCMKHYSGYVFLIFTSSCLESAGIFHRKQATSTDIFDCICAHVPVLLPPN